jgi:hypothetical protein
MKHFLKKIKDTIIDKAISIVLTLVGTLIVSTAGHIWGVYKLGEAVKKGDTYKHTNDSLRTEYKKCK